MRKHLYRAKTSDNKEWIFGDLITQGKELENKPCFILPKYADEFTSEKYIEIIPETVGQFVSEAQNKKLFDGDILRSINHYEGKKPYYNYHIIQWSEKFHGWFAKNKSNLDKEDTNGDIQLFVYLKNCGDFEVIGSIHDHETA